MKKILDKWIIKNPIKAFLRFSITLSWIVITTLFLLKLPTEPGILLLNYIGLLGSSLIITYLMKGKNGFKELFSKVFKWKVNIKFYLLALFSIPVLTILISLLFNTFYIPQSEWLLTAQKYFVSMFSGFLIINLWEETGWTGFVQSRLMKENGLLKGSMLTAPWFILIHVPLYFSQPTLKEFLIAIGVLFFLAFFFRYLLGLVYIDTGKSLFLVGLLHASFNNSSLGQAKMIPASIVATILITLVYGYLRSRKVITSKL
ncbi:MAG: CPBP family intramembrane glutamic endopeptidase [Microgenomates group bacterium]